LRGDKPGIDDLMRTLFHAAGEELFAGREEREQYSQLVP
jgi:hypothetical protein